MKVFSSNSDSIEIVQLQNKIATIQIHMDSLEKVNKQNMSGICSLNANITALQDSLTAIDIVQLQSKIATIQIHVESLRKANKQNMSGICSLNANITALQDSLAIIDMEMLKGDNHLEQYIENTKQTTDKKLDNVFLCIQDRTKYIGIIVIVLFLGLSIFLLLCRKKIQKNVISIDKIKGIQKQIQEECIKLDDKVISLLHKQLSMQQSTFKTKTADHSLVLKVADEIVRIEMNLSRMDPSIKGYKQLAKAVERIKNNFLANGYEIIDMLGKSYNEGMKVVANFVSDENLKQGEQIITGIIKPQINYNGQMIQAAQITVSQNI